MKEFPDIKAEILEQANLRALFQKNEDNSKESIAKRESKIVIRLFNEVAREMHYDNSLIHNENALRRKDNYFRKSQEFMFKDKRLKNA